MATIVLLIEDNPGDARLVMEFLKANSPGQFVVDTAGLLSTGLERLTENTFDVILLDLGLPDSQGLSTVLKVKAEVPTVPVIALTGLKDEETAIKAVQAGAQDYIFKGQLDGNTLARAIRYAIERKKTETALKESEEFNSSLMEGLPSPIVVLNYDMSIKYVNPSLERLTGYSKNELIGKNSPYPWWPQEKYREYHQVLLKARDSLLFKEERLFQNKRGEAFWVELTSINIKGSEKREYILTSWIDITERKKAETALKESEEFNSSMLQSAPNPIHVANLDTSIRYVNPALENLTGYLKEEIIGRKAPYPWWPPDKQEEYRLFVERDIERKSLIKREVALQKKSGEPFWVEITSCSIVSEGKHRYHLANWVDITERKQAEEDIRRLLDKEALSTREWQETFDAITDIVAVISPRHEILKINKAGVEATGKRLEELVGKKCHELVHGLSAPIKDCPCVEALKTKKDITSELNEQGRHYLLTAFPVFYKGGEIVAFTHIIKDITERKKAEERLKHAAQEWRTTFDSITDAVSIHDRDFRLVRVNRAFASVLKMKPAELIGKYCYQMLHGADKPVSPCPHKITLETKKPASIEYFEPHLGIHLEMSTSPIFDDNGEVAGSVHVSRDISERKKMQEQLIFTDRLASIGELASGIAHELNNPLTSVIGFSQLLMEKEIPADIKQELGIINHEAQRTANIVKNLLTFSRKHAPVKQPVNINKVIEKVLELRAYEQKVKNIQVIKQFSELPEIMADYFQLQQVLFNLIVNAEYFMIETHNKGTLTITTERAGDIVRLSVADDGPGISEETRLRLFSPFFTTKPVGKGTGLGLSICHGIVTSHGGRIQAESKSGDGATFFVELPITQPEDTNRDVKSEGSP